MLTTDSEYMLCSGPSGFMGYRDLGDITQGAMTVEFPAYLLGREGPINHRTGFIKKSILSNSTPISHKSTSPRV